VSRGGEIVENEGEARLYPPLAPFNPPKNRAANHQSRARDAFFSSLLSCSQSIASASDIILVPPRRWILEMPTAGGRAEDDG
jgi:hypothetical protein